MILLLFATNIQVKPENTFMCVSGDQTVIQLLHLANLSFNRVLPPPSPPPLKNMFKNMIDIWFSFKTFL